MKDNQLSIATIKQRLSTIVEPGDGFFRELHNDERKGVQQALVAWQKSYEKRVLLAANFAEKWLFENEAKEAGHRLIAGIDEVGRGPLAGPVVAAAVILPEDFDVLEVNDSKKLSEKKREELFEQIEEKAVAIGIGIVHETMIDAINIYESTKVAMIQAVDKLGYEPDYLLIDAMKLDLPVPQKSLIKGDQRSVSIACASIVAKVTRDRLMATYAELYPEYGFEQHAGYGTKQHIEALEAYGITPIHRRSFAPVQQMNPLFLYTVKTQD